jgi:hypothetical protein
LYGKKLTRLAIKIKSSKKYENLTPKNPGIQTENFCSWYIEKVAVNLLVLGDFLRNFFKHKFSLSYLGKFIKKNFQLFQEFLQAGIFIEIMKKNVPKSPPNSSFSSTPFETVPQKFSL